jgi:lantibiotic modifying enzyme
MNVYDFDNTIYRGESGVDLFLYYLKKELTLSNRLRFNVIGKRCIPFLSGRDRRVDVSYVGIY